MQEVKMFEAKDGKWFANRDDCQVYEDMLNHKHYILFCSDGHIVSGYSCGQTPLVYLGDSENPLGKQFIEDAKKEGEITGINADSYGWYFGFGNSFMKLPATVLEAIINAAAQNKTIVSKTLRFSSIYLEDI